MSNTVSCGCGKSENQSPKKVLLYACSGGANVAEASDIACRELMSEAIGSMFCLAGLGAGIEGMIQQARDADINVVIDGCPMDCGRKIFDKLGLSNTHFVRATDMGLEKKPKGTRATDEEVKTIVDNVKRTMATI
jgi:uncharacterized metal-binding protein